MPSAGTQNIVDPMSGRLLVDNNAGGQPQHSYVYLNGIPIALVSGFSSINYVLSDQLGQPQKLVDGFATLTWDRVNDVLGATASQAKGLSTAISLRFPGQEFDAITGLHYNDQRDYDPALGRYIQPDPIGLAGGINPYGYAGNNPVAAIDPHGREFLVGAAVGGGADLLFQLRRNGGQFGCVNWGEAAAAALIGAVFPVGAEIAGEGLADLMAAWAVDGAGAEAAAALAAAMADAPEGAGVAAGVAVAGAVAEAGSDAAAAELAGAEAGLAAEAAGDSTLSFSQTTASPYFNSAGTFAGQSIADVASQVRAGTLAVGDVPVGTVDLGAGNLIVNTRSALSLMRAGVPQSEWNIVNMTGNAEVEGSITQRLIDNELTTSGTDVLRITGSGSNASTIAP